MHVCKYVSERLYGALRDLEKALQHGCLQIWAWVLCWAENVCTCM